MKRLLLSSLLCLLLLSASAQENDSTAIYRKRRQVLTAATLGGVVVTHVGLYQLWYKNYKSSAFHFINDLPEWQQMDKCGHTFSAYYLSTAGIAMAKHCGLNHKKAAWTGGMLGLIFQTPIELFDGFSSGWGASATDLAANTLGSGMAIGQQLAWGEQRIWMKWSAHLTDFAPARPNTLGSNYAQRMLKDYNGQTYWLSANLRSLSGSKKIPAWLNLAVGYGADGMYGGRDNKWTSNGLTYDRSYVKRYRQFYLSMDVDLTRIKTKSRFLRTAFQALNCLKIPFPALELNTLGEMRGHVLYL